MVNILTRAFHDLLLLTLVAFLFIIIAILAHLHPPAQKDQMEPPGSIIVELRWPDEMHSDVDLWVRAPGDVSVGYSNKQGLIFSLLKDDLGSQADPMKLNHEIQFSRGIPPGEYIVNAHFFRKLPPDTTPIPIQVKVSAKFQALKQLLYADEVLKYEGQEITVFRFKLTEKGELVPGSVNNTFHPLRAAQ